eukprot:scaffold442556_cov36-Prasinocladus_malaysianus.AAC.1
MIFQEVKDTETPESTRTRNVAAASDGSQTQAEGAGSAQGRAVTIRKFSFCSCIHGALRCVSGGGDPASARFHHQQVATSDLPYGSPSSLVVLALVFVLVLRTSRSTEVRWSSPLYRTRTRIRVIAGYSRDITSRLRYEYGTP